MSLDALAGLHARAFDGQGRAWSAQEFRDLIASRTVFVTGTTHAFALGRVIADEAELLTIATDPDHRRCGLGLTCLQAYEGEAKKRGATFSFLEVARDNAAARGLYMAQGYVDEACRTGYYKRPNGARVDALIMRKGLG